MLLPFFVLYCILYQKEQNFVLRMEQDQIIRTFQNSISDIDLPSQFTFPFYYTPHPLVEIAANELQNELETKNFQHNFGLTKDSEGLVIGKMFGVLIVQDTLGNLAYLAAFSGKLGNENHHSGFVPPVFDMLKQDSYFLKEEQELNRINSEIDTILSSTEYLLAKEYAEQVQKEAEADLKRLKQQHIKNKERRKQQRIQLTINSEQEKIKQLELLSNESREESITLKKAIKYWGYQQEAANIPLLDIEQRISTLKTERKERSNALQQLLFSDYTFLNGKNNIKSLLNIFQSAGQDLPPAGAGECSAPKLLQYAYLNQLKPIAMGEFWWGASPKSEIRQHKQFYPACRSKCEPILNHMLKGLHVEDNPLLQNPTEGQDFEIVYEDESLLVINKPAEFLSVPGKMHQDSVQTRIQNKYPEATGPLLVHRLDMSTSGLLLIAKRKEIHKQLQAQFLNRTIEKRYEAVLSGIINQDSGEIRLPLRVDLDNRPQQLVCYEHGKSAYTSWRKLKDHQQASIIELIPHTGRTHQLRVHCAHKDGLNIPIKGDDLYGVKADRLYLHAAYLKFEHPITKQAIELQLPMLIN